MSELVSEGQRNMAIATALANIVVGGIGFRVIHFFLDLPPNLKTTLNLTMLFFLSLIAVQVTYRVFLKKQEVPIGSTLIAASAATVVIVFTSPLGEYFVPASMKIAEMTTTGGTTQAITMNLAPIIAGLGILLGAIYLHKPTREKTWKWLTED